MKTNAGPMKMNKYTDIEVIEAVCPSCKKTFYYEEDDERTLCEECEELAESITYIDKINEEFNDD